MEVQKCYGGCDKGLSQFTIHGRDIFHEIVCEKLTLPWNLLFSANFSYCGFVCEDFQLPAIIVAAHC